MKKTLLGVAILLLAGCSRPILMSDVQWATDTCENHRGVQSMEQERGAAFFEATCNDGLVYSRRRFYGTAQR